MNIREMGLDGLLADYEAFTAEVGDDLHFVAERKMPFALVSRRSEGPHAGSRDRG